MPCSVVQLLPGALARKSSYSRGDRSLLLQDDYEDDEDGSRRKYTRRGKSVPSM